MVEAQPIIRKAKHIKKATDIFLFFSIFARKALL